MLSDLDNRNETRPQHWFAPKVYGFGATPVTWQGWAVTAAFVALVMAIPMLLHHPIAVVALLLAFTVPFIALVHAKTDGGLAWRWGPDR
ncbi:MAG: hypothetical protein K2W81_12245 [Sphingomonas sp.]|uniref:hypothetical protein n=1 Tax=Sphingomonas sp. TaxID=28214 RepID=UPI0025EDB71C|nr:hypothetical protein [Sphingomonas sp.]MBY0284717.1 hypothetical protein [Sphingomonas sp.]